jgi:hypothetical protein
MPPRVKIPHSVAMAFAVRTVSPVSIRTNTPLLRQSSTAFVTLGRKGSITTKETEELLRSPSHSLIIYNACFGGGPPELNKKAKAARERYRCEGEDLSLFKAVIEIGRERSCITEYSEFGFAIVPTAFAKWVGIEEYDGLESPFFDINRCVVDRTMEILDSRGSISKEEFEQLQKEANDVKIELHHDEK